MKQPLKHYVEGTIFLFSYMVKKVRFCILACLKALRVLTKPLPHFTLVFFVEIMCWPSGLNIKFCHKLPLLLRGYMWSVLEKISPKRRGLIIYDQLNHVNAKYYTRFEAE